MIRSDSHPQLLTISRGNHRLLAPIPSALPFPGPLRVQAHSGLMCNRKD